ncbi:MAG: 4-hydroxybenzoate octaprenyltransferase [Alphaproteobacteria bacterium]|nr:4-hydroxybenzoate octaprenyltransferase [Alphaproteobacteria bacterium]
MLEYIKLMRLNQATGYFLLFWPSSFGLLLASKNEIPLYLLSLFFIGSIIMRGAGCIVNDIVDRDIDKHVLRTKNRPIAKGTISVLQASVFLMILTIFGLFILLSLPMQAIYVGLFSILLVIVYPFMKRITHYPQAFLAITFNIGLVIGYFSIQTEYSIQMILLYLSCMCWTMGYDTIYGHQDKKYDKKIGIKSTSITFGNHTKSIISIFYCTMVVLLFCVGYIENSSFAFYLLVFAAALHMFWQVSSLDIESPHNCFIRFRSNILLGLIIFLALLLS